MEQAVSEVTRAIEIDPNYVIAYKNRGLVYEQENNYDAAISDYTKTIEINPKDADAYALRANAYYLNKEPEKALNDFCKAKSLGFKCPPDVNKLLDAYFPLRHPLNNKLYIVTEKEKEQIYHLFMGDINENADNNYLNEPIESTIAFYQHAGNKYGVAWTYTIRGDIYAHRNDFDQAVSEYTKAIKIDSNFTFAYTNRGKAYYYKSNYDQAVFDLTNAIKTVKFGRSLDGKFEPEGLQVITLGIDYQARGIVYYSAGEYKQAISDLTEAIKFGPGYAYCYYFRGRSYEHLGNHDQAVSDYNKAAELEREHNNRINEISNN